MTIKPQILEAQGIKKKYQQGAVLTEVLHGVNARFIQGLSYAITGVSGSGKSTFMHILAGLDTPDYGAIYFNGQDIASYTQQEKERFLGFSLGLAFQNPYLIHELSVLENVMLKGMIVGMDRQQCSEHAYALLKRVGLDHKAYAHIASLSGGQQQRVALVRALFNKPVFFLADEPTGNLDHDTAKTIVSLLLEYQQVSSMGLVISSHDPYIAQAMNEVWHMDDGILNKVKD